MADTDTTTPDTTETTTTDDQRAPTVPDYLAALAGHDYLTTGSLAWLTWVAECLHMLECETCIRAFASFPAPPPEVRAFMRAQVGTARFEVFLRRVAGFAGSPLEQKHALDVYETLSHHPSHPHQSAP